MKVVSSLKSLKNRDKNCQIVKRRGVVFVINKITKRFKAKQA
jgi:large subunit ribosomal protein L36